jgi:hypothetical protein
MTDRSALASEASGMADKQFKTLIDGECPLWKRAGRILS